MSTCFNDAEKLQTMLASYEQVLVAFSGGVDSSVVAAAAFQAKGDQALAVTATSPSVPQWQLQIAEAVANEIGISHRIVTTQEVADPRYRQNDRQRCYCCKQTLYSALQHIAEYSAGGTVVSGTNADDLGDFRPGIAAGTAAGVVTPLADLGFTKQRVRMLAAHYGLSNRDLPASPCLASRIAYGVEVTPARLRRIELAEQYLRRHGFDALRVRLHHDDLARIEVPRERIGELMGLDLDGALSRHFRELGFRFVSVDLDGFQSGSLNKVLVSLESID